jgi:hypothetical protein
MFDSCKVVNLLNGNVSKVSTEIVTSRILSEISDLWS